jgi:hypothetical protein
MPKPLPDGLPRSRYVYEAVAIEIRSQLKRGQHTKAAKACKLSDTGFAQRLRGEDSKFAVEHFGAIADLLNAPPGWPFIPWAVAERMERALKTHPK